MRIKVTGYIDADELEENYPGSVDSTHSMGVSEEFYAAFSTGAGMVSAATGKQAYLEELDFERVDD